MLTPYRRFKNLLARYHLLLALIQPRSWSLPENEAKAYTRLPPPPTNAFIIRRNATRGVDDRSERKPLKAVPPRKLVLHLLKHRSAATAQLGQFLNQELESRRVDKTWIESRGGKIPSAT